MRREMSEQLKEKRWEKRTICRIYPNIYDIEESIKKACGEIKQQTKRGRNDEHDGW